MATTFHYRCPSIGRTVQGWSADDVTDDDTEYQSVACLACALVHLVNLKTGKVLGAVEDLKAARLRWSGPRLRNRRAGRPFASPLR